jgi:hypothetical protein
MPQYPIDHQIHRALISQWDELYRCAKTLNNNVLIEPNDAYSFIKIAEVDVENGTTSFEVEPVLFNLPESQKDFGASLFVVVRGLLTIDRSRFEDDKYLQMTKFNTRVAYFRQQRDGFEHVLGAHFDIAIDDTGHPAYHMQFDDYKEVMSVIDAAFGEQKLINNCMASAPKLIRIPCAQLDTFSIWIQLVADHLLGSLSSDEDKATFKGLLAKARLLHGTGHLIPRLQQADLNACFRAHHWYP